MKGDVTREQRDIGTTSSMAQIKLLLALDALLREGSVSAAAASLGLQVSAVSRMLGELRDHYGDPILVRTGRGMRPTPFAETLRLRVRAFSVETEALLSSAQDGKITPVSSGHDDWHGKARAMPLPLAVSRADQLDAAPTPNGTARRLAAIGDNADPHRRLARYIATTAPGPGRSRPLTVSEARDALTIIIESQADPIQVGALLTAMHYRGPTAGELAGFADAIRNSMRGASRHTIRPDLDWPAYVSPRVQTLPWFIHSARLVGMAGYKVLMHGHFGGGADSGKLEAAARDADIPTCLSIDEVEAAFQDGNVAYMPIGAIAPQAQSLLGLYPLFEMRNPVNAAVNLINPLSAPASIVGAAQASRRDLYRDAAKELDIENIAVIGSTRDIAELTPDKPVKIFRLAGGEAVDTVVPACRTGRADTTGMLSQREYWRAVWSGAARDRKAEAVILHTAATALLALSGRVEARFEDCLARAADLWARRNPTRMSRTATRNASGNRIRPFVIALSILLLGALPDLADAQQKGDRPKGLGAFDGSNALSEMHGGWRLTCGVNNMRKLCVMAQPLARENAGHGDASIEITPIDGGRSQAIITLPFTVDLARGVRLAVDDGKPSAPLPLQGCSEYGCHAVAVIQNAFLNGMRTGSKVHLITASADARDEIVFHADLEGFAASSDRALKLLQ
ncbi:glycosyl transferase family protein [Neorhizobium sp. NCHU2750]|uniref:glycosyl transferase family protein n=1 Tax=Neorhizobium sp. NCHU2750 TaxID=1825976 RepID=UPI0013C512DF